MHVFYVWDANSLVPCFFKAASLSGRIAIIEKISIP